MKKIENRVIYNDTICTDGTHYVGCSFRSDELDIDSSSDRYENCNFNCKSININGITNEFYGCRFFGDIYLNFEYVLNKDLDNIVFFNCKAPKQVHFDRITIVHPYAWLNRKCPVDGNENILGFEVLGSIVLPTHGFAYNRQFNSFEGEQWDHIHNVTFDSPPGQMEANASFDSLMSNMAARKQAMDKFCFLRMLINRDWNICAHTDVYVGNLKMVNSFPPSTRMEGGFSLNSNVDDYHMRFYDERLKQCFVCFSIAETSERTKALSPFLISENMFTYGNMYLAEQLLDKKYDTLSNFNSFLAAKPKLSADHPYDVMYAECDLDLFLSDLEYRMPWFSEFTYCSHGYFKSKFPWGEQPWDGKLYEVLGEDDLQMVHSKRPNAIGLFDMIGNMPEIVKSEQNNASDPVSGTLSIFPPPSANRRSIIGLMHKETTPIRSPLVRAVSVLTDNSASCGFRLAKDL